MTNPLTGKTILLTGGTGSFGQKFVEIVLQKYDPRSIRVYSRGEFLQWQMEQKFNSHPKLRFFIGDVRDKARLSRAATDVDIIIHAAALKQVPTCEYNPIEAVRTNIEGTANIINTAINAEVNKVIFISSDKAVQPVNLYGATKLVAEKLVIQANSYTGGKGTIFSCTRYGNVAFSRGSVIPLWEEQKNGVNLLITDKRATRFWLTLQDGVQFVIDSLDKMQGGEIFMPKIPSVRVLELAEIVAPNSQKKVIGLRPGEKLHEILLNRDEARHSLEFESYYVINPEFPFWKTRESTGAVLPEGFEYASDTNKSWISKEKLRGIIEEWRTKLQEPVLSAEKTNQSN